MKHYRIFLSYAVLLLLAVATVGCQPDDTDQVGSSLTNDGFLIKPSFLLATRSASPQPTVLSMRVIAFDDKGKCVANSLFEDTDLTVAEETTGWKVTAPDVRCTPSANMKYDVYAILNEDGIVSELEGTSATLTSLLSAITVGSSSMVTFLNYYNSRLSYDSSKASSSDPAFIVSAATSITVDAGASLAAQTVTFTAAKTSERTMAEVTIDRVTSEPASGSYTSTDVPRIFILDLELTNVPAAVTWTTATNSTEAGDGQVTRVKFGGKNASGYYNRTWPGTISGTFNLEKLETINDKLWRMNDNNNPFLFESDTDDYDEANRKGDKNENTAKNAMGGFTDDYVKNGTLFNKLNSKFASPASSSIFATPTGDGITITSDYWTATVNKTLYVPENVTSEKDKATMIHIRAAIATPQLGAGNGVGWTTIYTDGWDDAIYQAGTGELELYTPQQLADRGLITTDKNGPKYGEAKNKYNDFFKAYALTEYGVIEYEKDGVTPKNYGYLPYITGFMRSTKSSTSVSVMQNMAGNADGGTEGAVASWEAITTSAVIHDFYIPVNNQQFDGDYSVRRNTRYTVTLRMNQGTYDAMTTEPAPTPAPPYSTTRACTTASGYGIEATVTTEKIKDYED